MATWGPYLQLLSINLAASVKSKLSPEHAQCRTCIRTNALKAWIPPFGMGSQDKDLLSEEPRTGTLTPRSYNPARREASLLKNNVVQRKRRYKPNHGGGSTPF